MIPIPSRTVAVLSCEAFDEGLFAEFVLYSLFVLWSTLEIEGIAQKEALLYRPAVFYPELEASQLPPPGDVGSAAVRE